MRLLVRTVLRVLGDDVRMRRRHRKGPLQEEYFEKLRASEEPPSGRHNIPALRGADALLRLMLGHVFVLSVPGGRSPGRGGNRDARLRGGAPRSVRLSPNGVRSARCRPRLRLGLAAATSGQPRRRPRHVPVQQCHPAGVRIKARTPSCRAIQQSQADEHATTARLPRAFDVIVSCEMLEHMKNYDSGAEEGRLPGSGRRDG